MSFSYKNKKLLKIYSNLPTFLREFLAFIYSKKVQRRRFGGVFSVQLEELKQDESQSFEERKAKQLKDLKAMLTYAGEYTHYYRELFSDKGFDPRSVRSIEELREIPFLTKDIILSRQEALLAENFAGPTMTNQTSGTTGTALTYVLSEEAHQRHYACLWFHYSWAGFKPRDRLATLAGHPVAAGEGAKPIYWLLDRNENELMFSPYHLSPKTVGAYTQALIQFQPVIIRGYPSLLYLIALHLLEEDKHEINPKGIFTYGETTYEDQRQVIEQAFKCPVYSSYGNGEHAGHLLQCREGNYHEVTESAVIEVLRPDGTPARPGETGELIATSLINKAMPMIRYRINDFGIQTEGLCACGRTSPILKDITGRNVDIVVTPDGRHLRSFGGLFLSTFNVKEAQIIQEEIDTVTIKLVIRPEYNEHNQKDLIDSFHELLGDEVKIHPQIVDDIPRTAQGKFRLVISKVPIQI